MEVHGIKGPLPNVTEKKKVSTQVEHPNPLLQTENEANTAVSKLELPTLKLRKVLL